MVHYERERRWLITKMRIIICEPELILASFASSVVEIKQGYLGTSHPDDSFRARIKDDRKAEATTKRGKGIERYETPPKDSKIRLGLGREVMAISRHQLFKTRYTVGPWEVDVLHAPLEGIILLELEEKEGVNIDGDIQLPNFAEEAIEVTDTLTSSQLARLATELNGLNLPAMPFVMELLHPISRIGIAGDPGSGKTGTIDIFKKEFPEIHFVPEAAEILINKLGVPATRDPVQNRRFQKAVYDMNKTFEKLATSHAVAHGKKGLLFDRSNPDGAGYFDKGVAEFETFIGTSIEAEFRKINIAIYLEIPSREIYERCQQRAPYRTETYEQAKARGARTKAVWLQHPNIHVIGNDGGWDVKVDRVRQLIKAAIKT
ncbi:MAG: AAA family ATPase [Candidatus Yanofskybacteria bacterium]|nr:AAA family ATPase [Candidatus Yanofskybacteria bacterium]